MAKSIRSKGMRKARALKRSLVFEPVETKRIERLAARQEVTESPMEVNQETGLQSTTATTELTKDQKERLFMSGNQYKKKQKARKLSMQKKTKKINRFKANKTTR